MTNSADPDQLASSEANWSGSTLFAKTGHDVFSKRSVNKSSESIWLPSDKSKKYWTSDEHYRHWSDATEHSI